MHLDLLFQLDWLPIILMIQTDISKTIDEYGMFNPGDKVIVGVSGGSDSVCLLHLLYSLKKYRLKLIVAHLNHGLRDRESDRDEKFVEETALKFGLKYIGERCDTESFKNQENLSTEDAARRLRYRFFDNSLKITGADKIATAHNLEDQAETVLMRMLRGSGSSGLSGIPPVNGNIVRPLISISSSEIKKYLKSQKIKWIEDSSNSSKIFLRNKIRHELIPELSKYNPKIVEVLSRTSNLLRLESDFLNHHTQKAFKSVFVKKHFGYIAKIDKYSHLHKAIRLSVLRMCIEKIKGDLISISTVQILNLDDQINSVKASSEVLLPGKLLFSKGYKVFSISGNELNKSGFNHEVKEYGKYSYRNGFKLLLEQSSDQSMWLDENTGHFSLKKVSFPLNIRNVKPGDKFKPLGSKGFKKIKDFFIDEKVPRFLRKTVPIVECKEGIIWVGGFRIDDRFKVDKREKNFLRIRLSNPEVNLIKDF